MNRRARFLLLTASLVIASVTRAAASDGDAEPVHFVFTSDVHYGILRAKFQGQAAVDARVVNAFLVEQLNTLLSAVLPDDGGLGAHSPIRSIDFLAIGGDIANRQEALPVQIQSATMSWQQFSHDYLAHLSLKNSRGQATAVLPVPGNHDVADAIGSTVRLNPARDAASLVGIYNLTMKPAAAVTNESFRYEQNRIQYSRDFRGLHCVFLTIWPDTQTRAWMEKDLQKVPSDTPVVIFCHDPPEVDTRHLINPNGDHSINSQDRFENLLSDICADGNSSDVTSTSEQRQLAGFLKKHPNIKAYFHGHNNWNEFYTWNGPDNDVALNVFRADSPMKGKVSAKDESKLSFQFVVFDPRTRKMTVRECLWNALPADGAESPRLAWGKSTTVDLSSH